MSNKKVYEHTDKLGNPINLDSIVAFPMSNSLSIGKVIKINPVMIKVKTVPNTRWGEYQKYPSDTIVLNGPEAIVYILKHS